MKKVKKITIEFEDGEKYPYKLDSGYTVTAISNSVLTTVCIDGIQFPLAEKMYRIMGIIIHPEYVDISKINDVINNFGR